MKANSKYTVGEILEQAGFDPKQVGKIRVRVAGLPVNNPYHLVKLQPGTKKVEVIFGQEVKEVELDGDEKEFTISELAHKVIEKEGKLRTEKAEAIAEAKKPEEE